MEFNDPCRTCKYTTKRLIDLNSSWMKAKTRDNKENEPVELYLEAWAAQGVTCRTAASKIGKSHDLFKFHSVEWDTGMYDLRAPTDGSRYCSISFNSAGPVMRYRPAEILILALLEFGHDKARNSAVQRHRPQNYTMLRLWSPNGSGTRKNCLLLPLPFGNFEGHVTRYCWIEWNTTVVFGCDMIGGNRL